MKPLYKNVGIAIGIENRLFRRQTKQKPIAISIAMPIPILAGETIGSV
jgi:hypothetical protein